MHRRRALFTRYNSAKRIGTRINLAEILQVISLNSWTNRKSLDVFLMKRRVSLSVTSTADHE